jgi:hypothetical protein
VRAGDVSIDDLSRPTGYVLSGGRRAARPRIDAQSDLTAIRGDLGVGASFALTWGLLRVRDAVASRTAERPAGARPLRRDLSWIVAAAPVAVTFVGLLGPGIRLSR